MIHETGCINCGKDKYDSINGVELCFKHYRHFNAQITDMCVQGKKFEEVHKVKYQRSAVRSSWNALELAYYMLKNKAYCTILRERALTKLVRAKENHLRRRNVNPRRNSIL